MLATRFACQRHWPDTLRLGSQGKIKNAWGGGSCFSGSWWWCISISMLFVDLAMLSCQFLILFFVYLGAVILVHSITSHSCPRMSEKPVTWKWFDSLFYRGI